MQKLRKGCGKHKIRDAQLRPQLAPIARLRSSAIRIRGGKLIVFEGVDGAGKTTLSRKLYRTLTTHGIPCLTASFPGRKPGSISAHIYRLYHNPKRFGVRSIDPRTMQLIMTAAHIDVIEATVLPQLRNGKVVILDRYWWSTQIYGRESGLSHDCLLQLIKLEQISWRRIAPSVVFLVTRIRGQRRQTLLRLTRSYRAIARKEARRYPVRVIANDRTVSNGLGRIMEALKELDIVQPTRPKK